MKTTINANKTRHADEQAHLMTPPQRLARNAAQASLDDASPIQQARLDMDRSQRA
jgi:hypothetical protein